MKRHELRRLCDELGLTIQQGTRHMHIINRHGVRIGIAPRCMRSREIGHADRNMIANFRRNADRRPEDGLAT